MRNEEALAWLAAGIAAAVLFGQKAMDKASILLDWTGSAKLIAGEKGWLGWRSIVVQAAHESGVLTKKGLSQLAAPPYYNIFGFTDGGWSKDGKPTVDMPTTEWKRDAHTGKDVAYKTSRLFRRYPSWLDSMRDWARLVTSYPRYAKAVQGLKAGDHALFAQGMQEGGYATDPAYGAKLVSTGRTVDTLIV